MSGNANLNVQSVFNMTLSGNGPMVVPFVADFTTATEVEADLSQLVANGNIDFVSGAYFDNKESAEALTIKAKGSNQKITIPAGAQAYMPILSPNEPKFILSCDNSPGILIPIFFYNIPLLPYMWPQGSGGGSATDVNVIDTVGLTDAQLRAAPVDVLGPLTDVELRADPVNIRQTGSNLIDDLSLTLDGTNQTLANMGDATRYFIVQNPTGNNPILINLAGGDATVSGLEILGGGSYSIENGVGNVSVTVSGTNGENIIAFGGH